MSEHLSDEQYQELEAFIEECQTELAESSESEKTSANHLPSRMSQEYVEEKLAKYKVWMTDGMRRRFDSTGGYGMCM